MKLITCLILFSIERLLYIGDCSILFIYWYLSYFSIYKNSTHHPALTWELESHVILIGLGSWSLKFLSQFMLIKVCMFCYHCCTHIYFPVLPMITRLFASHLPTVIKPILLSMTSLINKITTSFEFGVFNRKGYFPIWQQKIRRVLVQ